MLVAYEGWEVYLLFTISENVNNYFSLGPLDGIGVTEEGNLLKIFVNHELESNKGYSYNGSFKGARVT